MNLSKAELLVEGGLYEEFLDSLTDEEAQELLHDWDFYARPNQRVPDGMGDKYRIWLFRAGRGSGKALALDTPIPTPDGWTTMGDLHAGDSVFDENGEPCTVTFATEVQYGRDCFRVRFDDGSEIIADAEHLWQVQLFGVVTTEQIARFLQVGVSVGVRVPHDLHEQDVVAVVAVEPVESVPVRCITVDSLSHLYLAGRTMIPTHNTRAASETLRQMIHVAPRIALIAPTAADVRDVLIEGDSGIMSVFPVEHRPHYEPSKRRVTFHNGAQAFAYSAEEPERLRGPQHHWAIGDEPASWANGDDVLSNLLFGLRLGSKPWLMLTGTPKPLQWLRRIADRPDTVSTTGSTYDNIRNLAPGFIEDILGRYDGTRLGRQEIYAEFLDDVEGALWTMQTLDRNRIAQFDMKDPWKSLNAWLTLGGQPAILDRRAWRTIVAVDPPGETAECGIIVASAPTQARAGIDHCVILDDLSISGRPEEWGKQVISALRKWNAERIMVESNQGGDMVRATIHAVDPNARVEKITARVSKVARAEPISALYERNRVHHIGFFPQLESQMTSWTADQNRSPDRMDALVHAVSTLVSEQATVRASVVSPSARRIPV